MNTILAPIDFSDVTGAVIDSASHLSRILDARLYVLHVAPPDPDFVGYEVGPKSVRESLAKKFRKEHHQLEELELKLKAGGVQVEALLVQGATAEKILSEADRVKADLIVMGSHGHGALRKLLVGSATEGVMRGLRCPVMVVPSHGRE